ncbi:MULTISPECIES: hypothetical protein [Gracilibacillus]|uniref:Uncharacterized protein n=1 Tax=Gracilibacillus dipsosauri TaxID=178340 RepID=A0A317KT42_9BACI|nr:hypothetical protein [Gracilibacillus dipsosauri]PWU66721.1 hypothetical protein DLJ74_20150 [Gracilibacillus dipsosauri]
MLLVSFSPFLYQQLLDTIQKENLHSFDIDAHVIKGNHHIEIEIYFGENFQHVTKQSFPVKILEERDQDYLNFCTKIGQTCKETMIQDYFKMMKL